MKRTTYKKDEISGWRRCIPGIAVAIGSLMPAGGLAQELTVPLRFGSKNTMIDERGQILSGTASQTGAIVQILGADNGIYPPSIHGTPHTNNPVLATVYIGQGTDPGQGPMGKVSGLLHINRAVSTRMFARVFNRPTLSASSFYTDSLSYTNSTTSYGTFKIDALQTATALDTGDADGDGVINSWEKSLGSSSGSWDSDGDGVPDGAEFRAGTGLTNAHSHLSLVRLAQQFGGHVRVDWDSVAGKRYQLQFKAADLSDGSIGYSNVNGVVTATSSNHFTIVTNGAAYPFGNFRILLVE